MIVWAVETLIASTLLMLLVLAIRVPVRRAFGPNIAYALWILPVGRMLLPPLPQSWRGGALPVLPMPEDITIYLGEPVALLPAEPASGIGWPVVLLALWTLGAIGFVAYHLIAHSRFCARVRRDAISMRIVAAGNVAVIETDAAAGPLAFGVWRKYVAFPRDFAERYDPLERDLALAHELGHHARGDLIANWVALVALALHWFNPVAWRAFRAFRADQEMACDALVLAGRARHLRAAYGRAIVKSAHGGAVSAACHLHSINEIKGRLRMLTKHETTSRGRALAGAGGTTALLIASLALTASGTQAAETVRTSVESAVGVELADIDLADIELPALPQSAPLPPPPAPLPPRAAPAAPPAPGLKKQVRGIVRQPGGKVTESADEDRPGLPVERRRYVFQRKDGTTWEGGPEVPMPPEVAERLKSMRVELRNMPEISSRTCRDGEGKSGENVINRQDGDKRVTIICTNRIERMASFAARDADHAGRNTVVIRRDADASALQGLRTARRSVEGNRGMSATQRSAALQGIDQAIREMEDKKD